jgi:hypothetical protein
MMGRQSEPVQLFYRFSLDHHVPADHMLRQIDAVLDLLLSNKRKPTLDWPVVGSPMGRASW